MQPSRLLVQECRALLRLRRIAAGLLEALGVRLEGARAGRAGARGARARARGARGAGAPAERGAEAAELGEQIVERLGAGGRLDVLALADVGELQDDRQVARFETAGPRA